MDESMDAAATWLPQIAESLNVGEISRFSKPLRTFAAIASIFIMLVGLLGNLLTIIALSTFPKVRNVAAAFIVSLCVADFIFCLIVLPFDSIRFIDAKWVDIGFLCVLVPFLRYGNVGVSLLIVGAITVNRYIMICHHNIYQRVYKKHWIALMILSCWLFSYGMQIPTLIGVWGKFAYDPNLETCSIIRDERGYTSKTFLFITGFVIPCIVIVKCYAKIFWIVHSSEARMRKHAAPNVKSSHNVGRDTRDIKQKRSEWRITKMVLAIFLSFVACYLPITIVKVADAEVRYPGLHVMGYLLLYFASCVNPIIYVCMNKQYRQAYVNLISCSRIRAFGSSAPGQNNYGQDYSKDVTMVSTVSIAMNAVKNSQEDEF